MRERYRRDDGALVEREDSVYVVAAYWPLATATAAAIAFGALAVFSGAYPVILGGAVGASPAAAGFGNALEFDATTPVNDSGKVDIQRSSGDTTGVPANPLNPTDDITVEFWVLVGDENTESGSTCNTGSSTWTSNSNILLDADVNGFGDVNEDWGLSFTGGVVMWGVGDGTNFWTICGTTDLRDSTWHHVAVTRDRSESSLSVYVDGSRENTTTSGPGGSMAYPQGSYGSGKNPWIAIGVEKHDFVDQDFTGRFDELRISNVVRYTGASYTTPTAPFTADANTAGLWHFDEGSGLTSANDGGITPDEYWDLTATLLPKGAVASPVWIASGAG